MYVLVDFVFHVNRLSTCLQSGVDTYVAQDMRPVYFVFGVVLLWNMIRTITMYIKLCVRKFRDLCICVTYSFVIGCSNNNYISIMTH